MTAMQSTPITECGLRIAFERMMHTVANSDEDLGVARNVSLFLFRSDQHMFEVSFDKGSFRRNEETNEYERVYEMVLQWHETCNPNDDMGDDIFVEAMNRYFGVGTACLTLDVVRKDLRSVFQPCRFRDCAAKAYHTLRKLMVLDVCECKMNMIEEGNLMCLTCCAGLEEKDLAIHMCGICHDICQAQIHQTQCCKQWIHVACHNKCGHVCPFCRAGA